jgi:hypothetical protein
LGRVTSGAGVGWVAVEEFGTRPLPSDVAEVASVRVDVKMFGESTHGNQNSKGSISEVEWEMEIHIRGSLILCGKF